MKSSDDGARRLILLILVLAVLSGVMIFVKTRPDSVRQHAAVGHPLMALALEPLTQGSRKLELSELRGKVVLVNFWGPWCGYCRLEFPDLAAIQKEYGERSDFEMLLVSCTAQVGGDLNQLREDTEAFMADRDFDLPVYSDPLARTRLMLEAHEVRPFGYPTTIVLDGEGIIRGLWLGYAKQNGEQMRELLKDLLDNAKPKTSGESKEGQQSS